MQNKKIEKFLEKCKKTHGETYDYSKVEYIDSKTPVCVICPEHGEFWQSPVSHVRGNGCPVCANTRRGKKTMNTELYIEKAKEVHSDKYDYSKVNYVNPDTKICIICPEHGEFWQLPYSHLTGHGCPKCNHKNLSLEELIVEFNKVHNNYYDYSLVTKGKLKTKVKIICPKHGVFEQTATKHLKGQGCPLCWHERHGEMPKVTKEEYIERANEIHGNKYDYSNVELNGLHSKIKIICPKHGEFEQLAYDHLNGHGCPSCSVMASRGEEEIYDFICNLIGKEKVERRNREILGGKEIDIYIPLLKIGIEYNGVVWHSEKFNKGKYYHLEKTEKCFDKGIKLFQIFEDEYEEHKEIILSKIKHLLNKTDGVEHIPARKTVIKDIDINISKEFLSKYHIQGYGKASVYLGCYYNDELVGVMTFKKDGVDKWDLTRFATNYNYICVGVSGKLLKYFIDKYNPTEIKTFADRRWTIDKDNNLYTKIGFELDKIEAPDYRYTNGAGQFRKHKFNFRKKILSKNYGLPLEMTENEMCKQLGFYKVWDCGLFKYVWKKPVKN